jgi:predicted DsbA family dithiol-disulfide isomerase
MQPVVLEIFTDYVCPWCYLCSARTERLRAAYQIEFRYTLFPLHPETPDEGMSLEELFANRSFELEAAQARLATLMADEALPYGPRTMTYNSRLAQELAKWAESQNGGTEIHAALYRAYFVEGLNIGLMENLMTIVRQLDLPEHEAREALLSRRFRDVVDTDWKRCRNLGITAVPTFVVGDDGVVGAQPYEVLEALLVEGGAAKR